MVFGRKKLSINIFYSIFIEEINEENKIRKKKIIELKDIDIFGYICNNYQTNY
jgi:hypothetical protein